MTRHERAAIILVERFMEDYGPSEESTLCLDMLSGFISGDVTFVTEYDPKNTRASNSRRGVLRRLLGNDPTALDLKLMDEAAIVHLRTIVDWHARQAN